VQHLANIEELRHGYRILIRKSEGTKPTGRARHTWDILSKLILKHGVRL
jgi:hypothetical protein